MISSEKANLVNGQEKTIEIGRDLPAGAYSLYPVSYTHLRAHETVLDLVCRLLLEKKKPHNIRTKC